MFPRLTLALVLSFQQDGKTILWAYSERWSFLKWQFDRRKESLPPAEAYQKAYLQQKFLPRSIAWEFIHKSSTVKSQDTTKNLTEWGCKTAKDHLEPVMTEEVSSLFCK